MADFIAVIRRAVDGLSDNTPDMRAKVYERARSAVVRQLENMKPRPPEAMFQKQLDKLDAAIREVEAEHAEALPVETAPAAAEAEPVREAPAEPVAGEVVAVPSDSTAPVVEEVVRPQEAVVSEPEPARERDIDAFVEPGPQPEPETHVEEAHAAPSKLDEPAAYDHAAIGERDEAIASAPVIEDRHVDVVAAAHPVDHVLDETQTTQPVEQVGRWGVEVDEEPELASPAEPENAVAMPKVSYDESDVVVGFNEFVQQEMKRQVVPPPPKKAANEDFSWDAPFDDLPEIPKPAAFEEALEAKQREIATQHAEARETTAKVQPSAREELEELIGFERPAQSQPKSSTSTATSDVPPEVARAVNKLEGKTFRHQKKNDKRRVGSVAIGLGIAGVLVLGGGAYGLWRYKDNVSEFVSTLMPVATQPAEVAKTKIKPADKAADSKPVNAAAKNTEVASLETDTGPQKFTQRLMPDGTEADANAAKVPVDQALTEGKSVAGQTEKGKDVAAVTDATTDANAGKPTATDAQPLAATQKMFLYEERLGQTSPVAVPGTIVWSEKTDTAEGRPDPEIQAQIDIPERKITALITFKRNTDASLPASHIIEIVFDMPKDFAEGNVENIQRVAFKQTEQDRGDALVAVPAKITDDFHMIALNDDAEARKANLELMKRAWIDIPITYRNGRRALITLEKGATGTAVFDKVLAEWSALGNQTAN